MQRSTVLLWGALCAIPLLGLTACGEEENGQNTPPLEDEALLPSVLVNLQTADPAHQIVVAQVVTPADGFIAIHDDMAGSPGAVLGVSQLLTTGTHANLSITLDRDVVDGETLYAMLHQDGNNDGVYSFPEVPEDGPLLDSDNNIIAPPFVVQTGDPPEMPMPSMVTVMDQIANPPNRVSIAQVSAGVNSFIAIHESDATGNIGDVIGVSIFLMTGVHDDVQVMLNRSTIHGETLYAMLHQDGNNNGIYEFPDVPEDGPVLDPQGAVIAPSFAVALNGPMPAAQVVVMDQVANPPTRVTVASVVATVNSFIAVHEGDGQGGIGGVVGNSALLMTGTHTNVPISLSRPVTNGERLYAMLHQDGNGNGIYEFPEVPEDGPVLDPQGMIIAPGFTATLDVPMPMDNVQVMAQTPLPANRVNISLVVAAAGSFIAVHEGDGAGGIGPVVGVSAYLNTGVHPNVTVDLTRDTVAGETLYAMLHRDGDNNEMYQFPGPDGPVMNAQGMVIAPPFQIIGVAGDPAVMVVDQTATPPNQIVIAQVVTAVNSFVAMHEYDEQNGTLGRLVGLSAPLPPGTHTNITVNLGRNAVDGERLYARLHMDGNNNRLFEYPNVALDGPILDPQGQEIAPSFTVTVNPFDEITINSQLANAPTSVVVNQVTNTANSFVAIYGDDGNDNIGPQLGVSALLPTGTHTDITVTLAQPVAHGQVLFARLHGDANNNGTFEYPGPDDYINDPEGNAIALPFAAFLNDSGPALVAIDQIADFPILVFALGTYLQEPGFIAIYEDDGLGGIGPMIGNSTFSPAGIRSNTPLPLMRRVVNGETLHVRLHTDGDNNMLFTYPGPDAPALDLQGNELTQYFTVTE